jgi:hypothetical protein
MRLERQALDGASRAWSPGSRSAFLPRAAGPIDPSRLGATAEWGVLPKDTREDVRQIDGMRPLALPAPLIGSVVGQWSP